MEASSAAHLAVFSDYRALAWVLSNNCMAFGRRTTGSTALLEPDSTLLLHATTRCFRGSEGPVVTGIIGKATVTSPVKQMSEPVEIGSLSLHWSCGIRLDQLVPPRAAVPLGPLAESLDAFRGMRGWRFKLMSAPVALDAHDYDILDCRLREVAQKPSAVKDQYTSLATAPV